MTRIKRIVRTGFFNFWRNGTVSMASVLVMIVTLSVIGFISFGGVMLNTALMDIENKIDINVTFFRTATEDQVLSIKQNLENLPEVLFVTYVTKDEALAAFKERNANKPTILNALDELGYNPLGAVLNIKARDPSQYASVAEFLKSDNALSDSGPGVVDTVNYFENKVAIDKLSTIIASANRIGLAVTLFLSIISVLIAFNTIRLTIYIAKDEISVMRLVGASTSYIQGPFVVVGIIYGLMAGVLTLILFFPATYYLGNATSSFYDSSFNLFTYYIRNFFQIVFIILGSGVLIGALSSTLAIRKYLKV